MTANEARDRRHEPETIANRWSWGAGHAGRLVPPLLGRAAISRLF